MNSSIPVLSIVVPMYNEEQNIEPFYHRLKHVLHDLGQTHEIICVNDGSSDSTLQKLIELRKQDRKLKIIDFSRNFGKDIAITAGINFSSGQAVIPIDADLQDPPEVIPKLVAKWLENYDVVYATRLEREGETWLKRYTAHLFYRIAEKIMPIKLPKDTGDFRLISRPVVEALKNLRERNRFMKGLFAWVGFSSTAIDYCREKRHSGRTKWNYWKLWNFALEGITSFSYVPLQFATYFGFIVAIFAFAYALFIVVRTIIYGREVLGYASLMTAILFLAGVQLVCIGVLGEYIGRIYNEVKQRPLYIIKKTWGI